MRGGDPQALGAGAARADVAANQDPQLSRRVLDLLGDQPVDLSRYRSRQGAHPRRRFSSSSRRCRLRWAAIYVNDINLFGRTWQVQVQAEGEDRASVDDIYRINVRNADGKMVPLRSLVEVRIVLGPQGLIRYNNPRAATVQGGPAAGVSSGQALATMDAGRGENAAIGLSRTPGPTSPSRRSGAEGQTPDHLRLRSSVRLPVPRRPLRELDHSGAGAALGVGRRPRRLPAIVLAGLMLDLYAQIGMIVLIGSCREERHPDRRIRQGAPRTGHPVHRAASEGARLRFRPVMMTSFAFILGLVSARDRVRRLEARFSRRRHPGLRWHAGGVPARHLRNPAALCDVPGYSRKIAAKISKKERQLKLVSLGSRGGVLRQSARFLQRR